MADVFFEVGADFSQAIKEIAGFSKQAATSAKSIETAFAGAGSAIAGFLAGAGVAKLFKEIVSAGLEAEQSNKKLTAALRLTGDATKENIASFKEYAETLSIQTGIDDDLIVSNVAFLKSLGATNEQTKQIIKTATDLSAAFGQDLGTSVDQLAKTFQGSAGALGKFIPGLNNLTKAQLAAGAGIELVSKQFQGLASQNVQGVAGAITVLEVSFSNLAKTFGSKVLESPAIAETINAISKGVRDLTEEVDKLKFNDLVAGAARLVSVGASLIIFNSLPTIFRAVASAASFMSGSFNVARIAALGLQSVLSFGLAIAIDQFVKLTFEVGGFSKALEVTGAFIVRFFVGIGASVLSVFASAFEAIASIPGGIGESFAGVGEKIRSSADAANKQYASLTSTIDEAYKSAKNTAEATGEVATETKKASNEAKGLSRNLADSKTEIESAIKSLRSELQKASSTASEQLAFEFKERINLINKAAAAGVLKGKQVAELRGQAERAAILASSKIQEQEDKDRLDKLTKRIQLLSTNPIQLAFDNVKAPDLSPFVQDIAGGITGALSIASQGAAGAGKLFSNIAGAAANAIIPGLGQAVGPIVDLLAQGPQKVKETFTAFFENLPTVLENIILAIPALLEAIANAIGPLIASLLEKIPQAIEALFARLPEIAVALLEGMTRAAFAFAFQMPFVAARLALSLTLEMPKVAISFINQLIKEAPRFVTELIKSIPSSIGGAVGGIGGAAGGLLGGIGDIFGFADGGRIPDVPSLRGDRGLTRVDAGEQIFSRDLTSQLEQFLAGQSQGSNQPIQVNLTIGTEQLASALFQVNKQGWRTA